MIKANELMIGNYVMDRVSGEWMIVEELGENITASLINRDKYPLPDGWQMAYIPLTPEVLEKVGFEKKGLGGHNNDIFEFKSIMIADASMVSNFAYCFQYRIDNDGKKYFVALNYLHEVQKLYLSLGEEMPKI